jgi:hypothetical protein
MPLCRIAGLFALRPPAAGLVSIRPGRLRPIAAYFGGRSLLRKALIRAGKIL